MTKMELTKSSDNDIQDNVHEPVDYTAEIRKMMHGFGDCDEPQIESAKIIEETVLHEIKAIIYKANEIASQREHPVVIAEDIIFLLRKDKTKLQRLLKYLELKKFKSNMHKLLEDDLPEIFDESLKKNSTKYTGPFAEFIETLDTTGSLLEQNATVDYIKRNRCIRAEMMAKKMDETHYIHFSKARSISFANKSHNKFSDWIKVDDISIAKQAYTVLGYLAYEIVAQIIDLVFLVRQDWSKIYGDSIDRLKLYHFNSYTYKPHSHSHRTVAKAISPAEIREALRRFWSPQLSMTGPFSRSSMGEPHLKFLSC